MTAELLIEYIFANSRMTGQASQQVRLLPSQWDRLLATGDSCINRDPKTIFGIPVVIVLPELRIEGRPFFEPIFTTGEALTIEHLQEARSRLEETQARWEVHPAPIPITVQDMESLRGMRFESMIIDEAVNNAAGFIPKSKKKKESKQDEKAKDSEGKCKRLSIWKD